MIRSYSLKLRQISEPASLKQTVSLQFFFYFWLGRCNKTLNDWSCEKQWVLFPFNLNVFWGNANKTDCFPWGQSLNTYQCMFLCSVLLQTHSRLDACSTNNDTSRIDREEFHASRVSHKQLKFFWGVMLFKYCYYYLNVHKCTVFCCTPISSWMCRNFKVKSALWVIFQGIV